MLFVLTARTGLDPYLDRQAVPSQYAFICIDCTGRLRSIFGKASSDLQYAFFRRIKWYECATYYRHTGLSIGKKHYNHKHKPQTELAFPHDEFSVLKTGCISFKCNLCKHYFRETKTNCVNIGIVLQNIEKHLHNILTIVSIMIKNSYYKTCVWCCLMFDLWNEEIKLF